MCIILIWFDMASLWSITTFYDTPTSNMISPHRNLSLSGYLAMFTCYSPLYKTDAVVPTDFQWFTETFCLDREWRPSSSKVNSRKLLGGFRQYISGKTQSFAFHVTITDPRWRIPGSDISLSCYAPQENLCLAKSFSFYALIILSP